MADVAARDLAVYFLFMLAATSVLSFPLSPATLLAVKTCPPLAVALVAACAAACTAVLDYQLVRRVFRLRTLSELRSRELFQKAEHWAKVAPFWTTAAFAALPLPFMIVRVLIPISGYPQGRYIGAVAVGRFLRVLVIAVFGTIVEIPNRILIALLIAGVLATGVTALVKAVRARRRIPSPPP